MTPNSPVNHQWPVHNYQGAFWAVKKAPEPPYILWGDTPAVPANFPSGGATRLSIINNSLGVGPLIGCGELKAPSKTCVSGGGGQCGGTPPPRSISPDQSATAGDPSLIKTKNPKVYEIWFGGFADGEFVKGVYQQRCILGRTLTGFQT